MQFELVSYPGGKAFDRARAARRPPGEHAQTPTERAVGAASARVADLPARARSSAATSRPGDRIRQEEVAERFGASRLPVREALRILEAEGLTEHEPDKGARVPRLDEHEVDVIYQMRERLEPLALAESLPHLTDADLDPPRGGAGRGSRRTPTSTGSSTSTASSTCSPTPAARSTR